MSHILYEVFESMIAFGLVLVLALIVIVALILLWEGKL